VVAVGKAHQSKRRVIFFCACEYPGRCHRFKVAALLRKEARRRGLKLSTIEWPGGKPTVKRIDVQQSVVGRVLRNASRVSLSLPRRKIMDSYFSLPWFSRVLLCSSDKQIAIVAGPARPEWYLPILGPKVSKQADTVRNLASEATRLRRSFRRFE
jgi:hypothetical protein